MNLALLPTRTNEDKARAAVAEINDHARKSATHPLILIVDDDPSLRMALADVLRDERYVVATAGDGAEAIDLLNRGLRPTAVLLDLWMPDLDGAGTLRRMRADPRLHHTPVIVITASDEAILEDVASGSSAVLRKPLNLDRLLHTIELHRLRN